MLVLLCYHLPHIHQKKKVATNKTQLHAIISTWNFICCIALLAQLPFPNRFVLCHFSKISPKQRFPRTRFEARPSAFTQFTFSEPHPPLRIPEGCSYNRGCGGAGESVRDVRSQIGYLAKYDIGPHRKRHETDDIII